MTVGDLAEAVARVPPGDLLPSRRSHEAGSLASPLRLLDALPLEGSRWVLVVSDRAGRLLAVPAVREGAGLRRAVAGDGVACALVGELSRGSSANGGFRLSGLHAHAASGERALGVDQTNESVVVGEAAVVKWTVYASTDPHPAPVRVTTLDAAGFADLPRPWGYLTWRADGGEPALLASVDAYLPGAVDGWTWCVADVREFAAGGSLAAAVGPAGALGGLVGRMHVALARDSRRAATQRDAAGWASRARAVLAEALAVVDGAEGARLRARAGAVAAVLGTLDSAAGTPVSAVHGDLHVGQVLRHGTVDVGWRYAVTDFDGNPVLPPEERTGPQPPARDVAGMLQSLDHVGRVVVHRTHGVAPARVERWIAAAQQSFLARYRESVAAAGGPDLLDERLLPAFRVEQECREFVYAARHLPHWRYVPDAALAALLPLPSDTTPGSSTLTDQGV